jgi:predicted ATPase/class 3 adenylate cyclase
VRQALGDSGLTQQLIQTRRGYGYRFVGTVEEQLAPSLEGEVIAPPLEAPAACLVPDAAGEDNAPAPVVRAALSDEPPSQGAMPLSWPAAPDAERRPLTVMVCELVATSSLARSLGPDDLYAVVQAYQETCAHIIRPFEGHIAQYRDAEIVVYFGYPRAHDAEAQRAVYAGLRIVEAMRELPRRFDRTPDLSLAIRVGLHTGVAVVGAPGGGEPDALWVLGDTPTLAAQIQKRAAPDTVVLSETTHRLIEGYFTCHELEAQTSQGMAPALRVYRVVRDRAAPQRLEATMATGRTPLVGRAHEVGLLMECWAQAKEGLGHVALISGEAGIGKSRLVQELQEQIATELPIQMMWRGAPYEQQSALHPVILSLQHCLQIQPEDAPTALLQRLEDMLASYGLALSEVVPLFAALLALQLPTHDPPLALTPQRQRQKTLEALRAWFLAKATQHPVLLIVEDLHWLDPSTLELLSLLMDQVATARLLLVLTHRPEFQAPWGFRAYLSPIRLGRLSHSQADLLVQRVAGKALPAEVQQHLIAHTDGVPLFIEEFTKMVLESGLLQAHASHYALTGPLPALGIPTTLHDSLMARLDRLAPLKAVAQLGATLGRTFAYDVLQAVSPWDELTLQHGLQQLVEAELLYQRGVPPQATYRFKHALIQDIAYQSLLKSTRQQYHQQIAQILEAQFPETVAAQPELLAHHYTEAGLAEHAIAYWQRAGEHASHRAAHREAVSHFTTGIALLTTLPETPAHTQQALTLHLALGVALQVTQGLAAPEVEHAYTQAYALCQQVGETPQLAPVLFGLWRFYNTRPQLRTARELGETLLRLAQHDPDSALAATAHYALGWTWFCLGALPAARQHLEESSARDTPDQRRAQGFRMGQDTGVACRIVSPMTLWLLGYPEQALARVHEALTVAHALAHPFSLAFARCLAAMVSQFRRDVPAVHEQAEAAVAHSIEQGFPFWMAIGTILRGWALAQQGQGEAGIVQVRQGIAAWQATGAALTVPYFCTVLADLADRLGYPDDGLHVLAEAHTLVEQHEERWWEAEICRLRGVVLLRQRGTPLAQAEAWVQRALAVARRQEAKALELRAAMSLARLWQQQGRQAEARELLVPIYGWFTEGFDTADLQEAQALLEALRA